MSEAIIRALVTAGGVVVVAVVGLIGARIAANDKRDRLVREVEVLNKLKQFPVEQALMREQVGRSISHLRLATANREDTIHRLWQLFWLAFFSATTIGLLNLPRHVHLGEWKMAYYIWLFWSIVALVAALVWVYAPAIQAARKVIARFKRRNSDGAAPDVVDGGTAAAADEVAD